MPKQPTTVSLTSEQRQKLDEAQKQIALSGITPSRADLMRAAIDAGLPLVVAASKGGA